MKRFSFIVILFLLAACNRSDNTNNKGQDTINTKLPEKEKFISNLTIDSVTVNYLNNPPSFEFYCDLSRIDSIHIKHEILRSIKPNRKFATYFGDTYEYKVMAIENYELFDSSNNLKYEQYFNTKCDRDWEDVRITCDWYYNSKEFFEFQMYDSKLKIDRNDRIRFYVLVQNENHQDTLKLNADFKNTVFRYSK
jgi:hypothetical protein